MLLSVMVSLKWFEGHRVLKCNNYWVLLKLPMQQGKDRLTGRFAAYSNKHQLKHRGKKKTDINNWFHRPSLKVLSRLHECGMWRSKAETRQSSKSHLTWIVLPNNIMQTLQFFVFLPTFFKASLWEPWQHSVGHPFERRWTLCLLSEPQTQDVILRRHEMEIRAQMCGLYSKRGEIILNILDWLEWNFQIDLILFFFGLCRPVYD